MGKDAERSRVGLAMSLVIVIALALGGAPAFAQEHVAGERPSIAVTTEVLGAIVTDLALDAADVTVLIPAGADPHAWQPSPRDTEAVFAADLIVANGLGLEEGLRSVLDQAQAAGIDRFTATDHITVRELGLEDVPSVSADPDAEHEHEHGPADPHFWLDPLAMRDAVVALGPALAEAGIDVGERPTELASNLEALHAQVEEMVGAIPPERRVLVTGHESLGYFADRYGFHLVGSVIPGLTTAAEPSARDIAQLVDHIREAGAPAVFTEVGTPESVARAVADETGARIVEVDVERLPEAGTYEALILGLAGAITEALGA